MQPEKPFDDVAREHIAAVGDPVLWFQDGIPEPHAAFVTALGMGTIVSLSVIEPNRPTLTCRDGVKHALDKSIRPDDRQDNGTWLTRDEWRAKTKGAAAGGQPAVKK